MKRILFIAIWLIVTFLNSWAIFGVDFARKEIEAEIINRIALGHLKHQDKNLYHTAITKEIKSGKEITNLCNEFIKANYLTMDYLIRDVTASFLKNWDRSTENPVEVKQEFKGYLSANIESLNPIVELFGLFIKSKNHGLISFTGQSKKNFTLEQMKAIAVRNIFPQRMTETGKPAIKICVAGEGFEDYPARDNLLEAFLFESVFNGFTEGKLGKKIEEFMNTIPKLNLSTDNDTALKRAQGALWWLLFQDKEFEKILLDNYKNKKDYLPFEITVN
jgi:hypothetical protein